MGFWTDKEKQENKQPFGAEENSESQFFSSSQQFNTFRQCKNDPNDNKFLICKNVTQSLNKDGKFETNESEEERIPAEQFYQNMANPFQGMSPFFGMMESLMNNNINSLNHGFQNLEKNLADQSDNTFFGRIKSLFNDNTLEKDLQKYYKSFESAISGKNQNEEVEQPQTFMKKSFSSSSSSRNCKQDPEDENFLICTTTTKRNINGQDSTEVNEERIPRVQQRNSIQGPDMNEIFREINSPSIFFSSPFFSAFPHQQQPQNNDPYTRQNNDNYQNRQTNDDSRNARNNTDQNNYKYPEYQQKKSEQQGGVYDL